MVTLYDAGGQGLDVLLRPEGFDCDCGRRHSTPLKAVYVGHGALDQLGDIARNLNMRAPALVADQTTWAVAGQRASTLLKEAALRPEHCVLPVLRPEADERHLGMLAAGFPAGCDGIISVGTGTMGDLGKMLAGLTRLPLINLATAPSMDGFASASASMLLGGLKTSVPAPCPEVIVADTDILAAAPKRMLLAGFGDMLAKYISLCEWRIGHLVVGEYYCPHVAALVRNALARCRAAAAGLMQRHPHAVEAMMEGLVLCGVAMAFAGVTRPASGIEHYFSHVWEMAAAREGRTPDLHGIQVGIGVALTLPLYARLAKISPDAERARLYWEAFDGTAYTTRVKRELGLDDAAAEKRRAWIQDGAPGRIQATLKNWPQILEIMRQELPDDLPALYGQMGLPCRPADIGLPQKQVRDDFITTKDIREKYVLSTLLSDLGLLEEFSNTI